MTPRRARLVLTALLVFGAASMTAVGAGPARPQVDACVHAPGTNVCVRNGSTTTTTSSPDPNGGGGNQRPPEQRPEPPMPETGPGEDVSPCPGPRSAGSNSPAARLEAPDGMQVEPGAEGSAPVSLHLPARATPVDMYFLIDTSGSMDDVIDSLKTSIARAGADLAATGIDPWVGLGEFNDRRSLPYRRLVQLGPLDCRMERALGRVRTGGGDESHLLALHQTVTGTGYEASDSGRVVKPGQHAVFRPGALHLVVHATDEIISEGVPRSPRIPQVVAAFKAADVRHVGVHALDHTESKETDRIAPDNVRAGLDRLAALTGTRAPAGGLDCDGDGAAELAANAPVTCPFGGLDTVVDPAEDGTSFGLIAAQIARALRGPTGITVRVADAAGLEVSLGSPARSLDLALDHIVDDRMVVRCPATLAGSTRTLRTEALVAGQAVAEATTVVQCLRAASTRVVRPGGPGVATAPPTPPPAPVHVPAPAASPAAVGATAQAQAPAHVAGLAVAPESEPQLAYNRGDGADDTGPDGDDARTLGAVAMAAGAAALARRRQLQPGRAVNRRR